ncbi:hypothetical protein [Bifidobacterium goeldii]|uniref:hypothetical protein n=1 Tax=Bifidobacterium goeldii TaxID=2306975 RepID=UPI000F7DDD4F|nr:hypothetical protein [Bifidobacterium goeldii]
MIVDDHLSAYADSVRSHVFFVLHDDGHSPAGRRIARSDLTGARSHARSWVWLNPHHPHGPKFIMFGDICRRTPLRIEFCARMVAHNRVIGDGDVMF